MNNVLFINNFINDFISHFLNSNLFLFILHVSDLAHSIIKWLLLWMQLHSHILLIENLLKSQAYFSFKALGISRSIKSESYSMFISIVFNIFSFLKFWLITKMLFITLEIIDSNLLWYLGSCLTKGLIP